MQILEQVNILFSVHSMKGYKTEGWELKHLKLNFNYLEMPLLAVFQIPLNDKINIEFQTDLYFAYGIGGKVNLRD
ncbi:MAG: hypothetical protein K5685_05380 [Bacteroidales bacterium]|nr:hypothetical protein [Bacteroidales bacterium]